MSIEAFWCISFHNGLQGPALDAGFGVVIFESGRVFGGDSNFYYNGGYQIEHGALSAKVRVKRFAHGMPSIMGLDDFVLIVEKVGTGDFNSNEFMIIGHVDGVPQTKVYVGFKRIENLP
jgi:hypothetical protein